MYRFLYHDATKHFMTHPYCVDTFEEYTMAHAHHAPQIAYLDGQAALSPLAGLALRVAVALTIWSERRRTRHRLLALDDRLLRDVGLDRLTALREGNRVFWRV
jgi:uncharacterized protein YjiS (DUF1127 family)